MDVPRVGFVFHKKLLYLKVLFWEVLCLSGQVKNCVIFIKYTAVNIVKVEGRMLG
jgi:hypothetical protein